MRCSKQGRTATHEARVRVKGCAHRVGLTERHHLLRHLRNACTAATKRNRRQTEETEGQGRMRIVLSLLAEHNRPLSIPMALMRRNN